MCYRCENPGHCWYCGMKIGASHQYTCFNFITKLYVTEKDCHIPIPAQDELNLSFNNEKEFSPIDAPVVGYSG